VEKKNIPLTPFKGGTPIENSCFKGGVPQEKPCIKWSGKRRNPCPLLIKTCGFCDYSYEETIRCGGT
jgi:hypothetical protein